MLYSRSLLVIHFKNSSVYMSIPNFKSFLKFSDHCLQVNKCQAIQWSLLISSFLSFIANSPVMALGGQSCILPKSKEMTNTPNW